MSGRSPFYAAGYDTLLAPLERGPLGRARAEVVSRARGKVLEVGAGTGRNLRHYRRDRITTLWLLEPDGAMRRRLRARLTGHGLQAQVVAGALGPDAPEAPAPVDTVVSTLALCAVAELERGLDQLRALLAPDGRLVFLEHVPGRRTGGVHRCADRVESRLLGCHPRRDTLRALTDAGFDVDVHEEMTLPSSALPLATVVSGEARVSRG